MAAKRRIVESIQAAASLINASVAVVKRAKELGCGAFKQGNRIDIEELRKWVSENLERLPITGGDISLKEQKLNEEIRKLKLQNDEKEKKLVPITKHEGEIREMSNEVRKCMYALPSRAPELAGLPVPDIEIRLTAWMDEVVQALGKDT